jgi:hypothetical protein
MGNKASYDEVTYAAFLAALEDCDLSLAGNANATDIAAQTAMINAALAIVGGVTPETGYTVEWYESLTPGMKTVLVTLDTTTPENYTVSYDGVALTYSDTFGGFTAEVSSTTDETLVPEITEITPEEMPAATVAWYSSLTPGMKTVLVTLDTTTPENYAVSYNGTALTYSDVFGGFTAEVSSTVDETLTPVVSLV